MNSKAINKDLKNYIEADYFLLEEAKDLIHTQKLYHDCMVLALSNENPAAWRSSWLLKHCLEKNDNWMDNYIPEIIEFLPQANRDGHKRELLKLLRDLPIDRIPANYQSQLFDNCMQIFSDNKIKPGTRSTACLILLKFAEKEIELFAEIQASFEMTKNYMSKGVRKSLESRINKLENKILKQD